MEFVIALIPTDSPGKPKITRKQDKKNIKYLLVAVAMAFEKCELNLFEKTILNIDFLLTFCFLLVQLEILMRNDYLKAASAIIRDPNILINVVSKRVKQLKAGKKRLTDSLEKLDMEDIALKEIIEGKITYALCTNQQK
ncbi:MAG: DNA-directed RNA polymerase subunit omega [Puniceicoccales bacterium]|nr:DNA-directed RNA polymerase subunit omega [Puniceicoccales bacterium]